MLEQINGADALNGHIQEQPLQDNPEPEQARYVVRLPVFEGPLDLLLHLIEKRQMEITTISLVVVTDQYLAYLQQWKTEQLPLANMAAFRSIAARLPFIKLKSPLPPGFQEKKTNEASNARH